MGSARRELVQRLVAFTALGLAAIVVAIVLLGGGDAYTLHARFVDSGQLVKGDLVEVSGRGIGTITAITLTEDNQADVEMEIDNPRYQRLRRGTIATIKAVGLSGVANRFIELSPGPSTGAEIEDGGVLTTEETRPIIDLDELLNALDPEARKNLQSFIRNGAKIFAGTTDEANEAFGYLNPALFQGSRLAEELARDRAAVERLLTTGATVASAVAVRREDVRQGITSSADTLEAIAGERTALQDALGRAPAVLGQAQGTLGRVRATLEDVRPALREARPVAPRLARLLRQLVPTGRRARPVLAQLRSQLPNLKSALDLMPALEKVALPASASTVQALRLLLPILPAVRAYSPDLVYGLTNSLGGTTTGYYDANGHFARISPHGGAVGLTGVISTTPAPGAGSHRAGLVARCPGAAAEPHADGSNPWVADPAICDPAHNHSGGRRR